MVGAGDRQVAGVVAQAVLLLERAVVLLVDDDRPGARQRREQRRAGADDDRRASGTGGLPGVEALGIAEPRMQGDHRDPETAAKARQGLRGEADLRHQHQRLTVARHHRLDQLQVDLGLAAAGDAVQQAGVIAIQALVQFGQRRRLLAVEGQRGLGEQAAVAGRWRGGQRLFLAVDQPLVGQRTQLSAGEALGADHRADHPARMLAQQFEQLDLATRAAQLRGVGVAAAGGELPAFAGARLQRPALAQQHRHRLMQGVAERVLVVARGEAAQPQPVLGQRFAVQPGRHRLQLSERKVAGVATFDDHPDHLALAQRHPHPQPRLPAPRGRRLAGAVIEQAAQRGGHGDAQHPGCRALGGSG